MDVSAELAKIDRELKDVTKQLGKVEANSRTVNEAIAGQGTFRGYSGDDCFLTDNLSVVQREIIKQLHRKEQMLSRRSHQLLKLAEAPAPPDVRPTSDPDANLSREQAEKAKSSSSIRTDKSVASLWQNMPPETLERTEEPAGAGGDAISSGSKTTTSATPASTNRSPPSEAGANAPPLKPCTPSPAIKDANLRSSNFKSTVVRPRPSPDASPGISTPTQSSASKGDETGGAEDAEKKPEETPPSSKNPSDSLSRSGTGSKRRSFAKRDFSLSPRFSKTPKRGEPCTSGPAHSVEEYLANTEKGLEAVASIKPGTVFWIKFSDTKEAWLECGVVSKVHAKSAKPYEILWRPYDSGGVDLADNPQQRIALLPRLFVNFPEPQPFVSAPGIDQEPPAGSKEQGLFTPTRKNMKLNVPPIGSWCIVKADQPWGDLGPFAFSYSERLNCDVV